MTAIIIGAALPGGAGTSTASVVARAAGLAPVLGQRPSGSPVPLGGALPVTATDLGGESATAALLAIGLVYLGWRLRRSRESEPDDEPTPVGHDGGTTGNAPAEAEEPTDNERVCQLLRAHGGRLKQSRIVELTDWSKAKVSRVLSQMEADDEISKIRLGRENLICLRGREPDAVPS